MTSSASTRQLSGSRSTCQPAAAPPGYLDGDSAVFSEPMSESGSCHKDMSLKDHVPLSHSKTGSMDTTPVTMAVTIMPVTVSESRQSSAKPSSSRAPLTQTQSFVRSQSAQSTRSVTSSMSTQGDICRICHCEHSTDWPLISPCHCSGSLKWVHQKCLQQWIKSSQTKLCEVCRYPFQMQSKIKPFKSWEKLDISPMERRKIVCSMAFHVIAVTCVVWSLYVLVDKTIQEMHAGQFTWAFWTKLVVIGIGFTGGLVFMYVQCRMYTQLFSRWKAYNKIIFVQDCAQPRVLQHHNNNQVNPAIIKIART